MGQTLYQKYGEFAGISGVVHDFYDRLLESEDLEGYFAGIDMTRLMDHQTKFLCKVLGGPDNYSGRAMQAAHAGLNITHGAFDEVARHLAEALEEAGVEPTDIQAILSVVEGARNDVVSAVPPAD